MTASVRSSRLRRIGIFLPTLLSMGLVRLYCLRRTGETDLGWSLAVGRLIATSGIPKTNALCWTALDHPWYATAWLFDWLIFQAMNHVGMLGVQFVVFLFIATAVFAVSLSSRRIDSGLGAFLPPLLALFLLPRIAERSFVVTWALSGVIFWLCGPTESSLFDTGDSKRRLSGFARRCICVPLIAIGSNLHSGAVFPAILLGIFSVEAFLLEDRRWREAVPLVGGFAALAANPGGIYNLTSLVWHAGFGSVVQIAEFDHASIKRAFPYFVLVPAVLVCAWLVRKRAPALLAITVVFGAAGFWAIRFMTDFEVVAIPILAVGLGALRRRGSTRIAGIFIAGALASILTIRWPLLQSAKWGVGWDETTLPVRAATFIGEARLAGKAYNGYEEGGYLEWALPDILWFQDGRAQAFPVEFFQQAEAVEDSPERFRDWLRNQGVEWAVATRLNRNLSGKNMFDSPDWALVYWDDASLIYVRRDIERLAPIVRQFEYHHFLPSVNLIGAVSESSRAQLAEWQAELDRFDRTAPHFAPSSLAKCALSARRGEGRDVCNAIFSLETSESWKKAVASASLIRPAE